MIINKLKKLFGVPQYVDCIVDTSNRLDIKQGYTGGSLVHENVLVVSNQQLPIEILNSLMGAEQAYYVFLVVDSVLKRDALFQSASQLIGPFSHIINVVYDTESGGFITNKGDYNAEDDVSHLFQTLQCEVDYLVNLNRYSTVTTVFISDNHIDSPIKRRNIEMMIRGLAEPLSKHNIICNGCIVTDTIDFEIAIQTALFLSGRYGQVLTSEVLFLNN